MTNLSSKLATIHKGAHSYADAGWNEIIWTAEPTVRFLPSATWALANDNPPEPGPGAPGAAMPAPAVNDNGWANAFCHRAVAVVLAGSILLGGTLEYLPTFSRPCQPTPIYSPETKLASLDADGRRYLQKAMERQEGQGHNTIAYRAMNPGNLNIGPWARKHGAIGTRHGIAVFKTREDGQKAMSDLIFVTYRDRTIFGMLAGDPAHGIKGYAPAVVDQFGKMGNPKLYAEHVAKWMSEMAAEEKGRQACPSEDPRRRRNHHLSKPGVTRPRLPKAINLPSQPLQVAREPLPS